MTDASTSDSGHQRVLIVDYGSQVTQLIARRVREDGVYCEVHPCQKVDDAFAKQKPLFSLPVYYPLAYYQGGNTTIDPIAENRQKQVVGLIRTNFLKRFESSLSGIKRAAPRQP